MTKLFTKKKPYASLYDKPINTRVGNQPNKNVGVGSKYGPKISSGFFGLAKGPVTPGYTKARNKLFTNLNKLKSVSERFNTLKQASGGSAAVNNILSGKRKLGGNKASSEGFETLKKSYNNYALTRKDYSYTLPNLSFEQYVRYSQPDYKPVNMFNTKELNKFRKTLNQRKTNPYAIATKIALNSTASKLPLNANNNTIANRISNLGYVPTPNVIRALREYKTRATPENIDRATKVSVALEEYVEVEPMSFTVNPAQPVRQLTALSPNKLRVVASNNPVISKQKSNMISARNGRVLRLEKFGFGTNNNPYLYSPGPVVADDESSV